MQSLTESTEKSIRETGDRALIKWANLMVKVRKVAYGEIVIKVIDGKLDRIEQTTIQDKCDDGL